MPRQSSIKLLPPDILSKLQACLRDPRLTQIETVDVINELLEAEGIEQRITKSALNRYALRMEQVGEKIKQSREVAQMWIGRLGGEPEGEVSKLLIEFVRTMAFETGVKLTEGDEIVSPKMIKDLSIGIERLERAASQNVKRDEEIRQQERERALEKLKEIEGKGTGKKRVDPETLKIIRQDVYGLTS